MTGRNELSLVVNLGRISIHSKMRTETSDIRKLLAAGKSKDQILNEVITQCYDQFSVCLSDIQVRYGFGDRSRATSELHT